MECCVPRKVVRMKHTRRYLIEAGIGLAIALLLLWTSIAAATDIPFVYQGL